MFQIFRAPKSIENRFLFSSENINRRIIVGNVRSGVQLLIGRKLLESFRSSVPSSKCMSLAVFVRRSVWDRFSYLHACCFVSRRDGHSKQVDRPALPASPRTHTRGSRCSTNVGVLLTYSLYSFELLLRLSGLPFFFICFV